MKNINECILYKDLINKLEEKIIGRSLTFPCGWVQLKDLEEIIDGYKKMED